jgi:tetratricopeptide (TPR) repeat protein
VIIVLLDVLSRLGGRPAVTILGGLLLILAPLSWQRNALWNDPIALYEDNLRHHPGSERAGETIATLYGQAGRFEDEQRQLEETLRRYPDNVIVRVNLAKVYAEVARWAEAYALLEEGSGRQPATADFYETAALLAERQGDRERAIAYLRRGLAVPGTDLERLWNNLGVLYSEAGEGLQAEAAFRSSLQTNPQSALTHLNLGKEYFVRQRWAEAVAALRRSQELEPGNPETLEGLGLSAVQLGDVATASWAADKLKAIDRQAWRRVSDALGARR